MWLSTTGARLTWKELVDAAGNRGGGGVGVDCDGVEMSLAMKLTNPMERVSD